MSSSLNLLSFNKHEIVSTTVLVTNIIKNRHREFKNNTNQNKTKKQQTRVKSFDLTSFRNIPIYQKKRINLHFFSSSCQQFKVFPSREVTQAGCILATKHLYSMYYLISPAYRSCHPFPLQGSISSDILFCKSHS